MRWDGIVKQKNHSKKIRAAQVNVWALVDLWSGEL